MSDDAEHIKQLMRQALDESLRLQICHLYKTWLTNPGELAAARQRAAVGLANAVACYRSAMAAVETWEG